MADTIEIVQGTATVVEVAGATGPQGPAGPAGTGIEVLTQKGDLLSRDDNTGIRVGIGSTGQILKVSSQGLPSWQNESGAVSSVAGRTGAITLTSADITDATEQATAGKIVKRADDGSVAIQTLLIAGANGNAEFDASGLTTDRTLSLPNASGSLELEGHGTKHNATGSDPIYNEMVAIIGSGNANVNGYYYLANDGGDVDYIKIGSRRRAKLVFSSSRWNIQFNGVTQYQSEVRANSNKPWQSTTWTNLIGSQIDPAPTVEEANVDSVVDALSRSVDFATDLGTASLADTPTSGNASSAQVVLGNDTRLSDARTPSAHAASHASAGSDPLFDQDLNTADNVAFEGLRVVSAASQTAAKQVLVADDEGTIVGITGNEADARASLGLGTAAVEAASAFAQASHSHELTALAATGATNGHVLTANGSNGATFAALPSSGVTGAASSASDVLTVSGANITGVDAGAADRLVFWDDSANRLTYLEAGSGLTISGTVMTASGGASINQAIAVGFVLN